MRRMKKRISQFLAILLTASLLMQSGTAALAAAAQENPGNPAHTGQEETTVQQEEAGEEPVQQETPERQEETEETPEQQEETKEVPKQQEETKETPEQQEETKETPEQQEGTEENPGQQEETKEDPKQQEETEETPEQQEEIKKNPGQQEETEKIPAQREKSEDEVSFNTGAKVYRVVDKEEFFDGEQGDAYFEEDGSYVIQIPEENPFFPYEVQFTYKGKVTNQWFLTPDDSVEIGGHTFYVSANFDNTVVTQMSFEVAGDTVIVYPEEKEFTDGDGAEPLSLLPLTEKRFTVDLSAYTPVELTMVSLQEVFTGNYALGASDKVIWVHDDSGDDYSIASPGDIIDLSRDTYLSWTKWQMIVGDSDQLAADNIRYIITIDVTPSRQWLKSEVYVQDSEGNRNDIQELNSEYKDYYTNGERNFTTTVNYEDVKDASQIYLKLNVNREVFSHVNYADIKVYEGKYISASEAMSGLEITDKIYNAYMPLPEAGYKIERNKTSWITMVAFDNADQVIGCLPIEISLDTPADRIDWNYLKEKKGAIVAETSEQSLVEGCTHVVYTLYKDYAVNQIYYQRLSYYRMGTSNSSYVTAAFLGQYSSISEAVNAGAPDIKTELFDDGYAADYSQEKYFTVFVGEDSDEKQEIYRYAFKAEAGNNTPKIPQIILKGATAVKFIGLKDGDGNVIPSYCVKQKKDSYSDFNYRTILVGKDVDLTNLAPVFEFVSDSIHLYTGGNSSQEVSGESVHDFSKGAVQYTAAAENGINSQNYWLRVIKAEEGSGQLYVNSLDDESADTQIRDGVIYSNREVMLDGYHDYEHNILLANMGTTAIPALSVELVSDVLELDEYWTLQGQKELKGFNGVSSSATYGELENLAQIRLRAKENIEDGTEASGVLKIKSGGTDLIVLTLTGIVGDPCIITKEIPPAVKYVPYGTIIQNNNKYNWNRVSYHIVDGTLPRGMELRENGELYGVPQETGEFPFTLSMYNSGSGFGSTEATLTLVVEDNTNSNVYTASDNGYILEHPVGTETASGTYDFILSEISDQLFVSSGEYGEFIDFWLNGEKLVDGVDYTKDSGSTRITIKSQTFKDKAKSGTNTIAAEFRIEGDTSKELRRTAQNFRLEIKQPDNNGNGGNNSNNSSGDNSDNNTDSDDGGNSGSNSSNSNNSSSSASANNNNGTANNTTAESSTTSLISDDLWVKDDTGWWCRMPDGTYPQNTWFWLSYKGVESWYFFDEQGYMVTGWLLRNGLWYYMDEQGRMCTSWQSVNGKWCYFNQKKDGVEGAMVMNTWRQLDYENNTDWYYFDEQGYMSDGWIEDGEQWYYLNPVSDGTRGRMYTGWQFLGDRWYYFKEESDGTKGALVTDSWVGDYYVNKDGVWVEQP